MLLRVDVTKSNKGKMATRRRRRKKKRFDKEGKKVIQVKLKTFIVS